MKTITGCRTCPFVQDEMCYEDVQGVSCRLLPDVYISIGGDKTKEEEKEQGFTWFYEGYKI